MNYDVPTMYEVYLPEKRLPHALTQHHNEWQRFTIRSNWVIEIRKLVSATALVKCWLVGPDANRPLDPFFKPASLPV